MINEEIWDSQEYDKNEDVEFHQLCGQWEICNINETASWSILSQVLPVLCFSKEQNGQITGIASNQGKLVNKQIFNINLIKMSTRGHLALRHAECCISSLAIAFIEKYQVSGDCD